MKKHALLLGIILIFSTLFSLTGFSQVPRDDNEQSSSSESDSTSIQTGLRTGAVTINGQNYQRIGLRTDVPIGKFGFGLDVELLMDSEGQIRRADWDEWTDYLDKIYYMRYGYRNSPFYIKVGGMDFSYLGYRNIIDGYTNMIEYPDVKRYGLEMAVNGDKVGFELFANDFKEAFEHGSLVLGGRASYKVIGKLEVGASAATDLNEYNGLKDIDNDNYPDPIDQFPENEDLVTEYDRYVNRAEENGLSPQDARDFATQAADFGLIDDTRKDDLFNLADNSSQSLVYSLDIGYPVIEKPNFSLELFSHYTSIKDYGWGITAPGMIFGIGKFLTFRAEYRIQSKEFLFGYFNNTYELERAQFVEQADGSLKPITKQEKLTNIENDMQGYFVGLDINFFNFAELKAHYQNMSKGSEHINSLNGSFEVKDKLIPVIHEAKAYYIQNNVQNFKEWKTPSTVLGYVLSYDFNGTIVGLDYRYTFRDVNGDGTIAGDRETIKTFGLSTKMNF